MRPIDTEPESQVKVENNGKDNISLTKQRNESLVDSSEHSTRTAKTTNRKMNKNSLLSTYPRGIREKSTYSEGEEEVTNNAKENSLNKQQNVNQDESQMNSESTGGNRIKSNENNDKGNISPFQQKDERLVDDLEYSSSTDETNMIRDNENKNNSLHSEGKKEHTNNTEEKNLNEQPKRDNVESHGNFESTGENSIKSNENNDKGNVSPVQQKDESLVDGLEYSTSTDENSVIRMSENKINSLSSDPRVSHEMSIYSEGKGEIHEDKKNNSLIEQQNGNKVDNPEYLDSTEENVMNTSEN